MLSHMKNCKEMRTFSLFRPRRATRFWRAQVVTSVVSIMILVSSCGATSNTSTSKSTLGTSKALEPLAITEFPGDFFFADIVAQKEGFFTANGLKVDVVKPSSGTSALQLVLSGTMNGLIADASLALIPDAQGQDLKIIGSVFNRNAWNIYLSNKYASLLNSHLTYPAAIQALKGMTIGVPSIDSAADIALQAVLKAAGLNPATDVHRVAVGLYPVAVGQFQAGRIDAYVYASPAGAVFGDAGVAKKFFSFATQAPSEFKNVPQGSIVVNGAWLNTHQAEARRWVAAESEAAKWIADPANLQKASTLFASAEGGSIEKATAVLKSLQSTVYPYTEQNLKISRTLFENEANMLTKVGLLPPNKVHYASVVVKFAQG